jgi:hypothetical protein
MAVTSSNGEMPTWALSPPRHSKSISQLYRWKIQVSSGQMSLAASLMHLDQYNSKTWMQKQLDASLPDTKKSWTHQKIIKHGNLTDFDSHQILFSGWSSGYPLHIGTCDGTIELTLLRALQAHLGVIANVANPQFFTANWPQIFWIEPIYDRGIFYATV